MKGVTVDMKTRFRFFALVGATLLAFCGSMAHGDVQMSQEIEFCEGWNAVQFGIRVTNDVNEVFRDWPVEWVALYDPAAFLDTKQYSAEESGEGAVRGGYRMWRRETPELAEFSYIPGDSILVCFATNGYSRTYFGEPCAPRITWHKSSSNELLNVVGFRVQPGEGTTIDRYFEGLNVGSGQFYVFGGDNKTRPFLTSTTLVGERAFTNGQVIAVASKRVSDWSGVLYVSPRNGIDFGSETSMQTLEIRNDGVTNRTVTVEMGFGASRVLTDVPLMPHGLFARDSLDAVTNGPWTAFDTTTTLSRELVAGETWTITFALDRSKLAGGTGPGAVGTEYGAILDVRDEDGGSKMRVNVPLKATSAGDQSEYAWPKGVWVAAAELDTVNFMLTEANGTGAATDEGDQPSGGKMTVRLPLYVDGDGKMTLLQRLWFGRNTNGVLRAYSGAVTESDEPLSEVKRLSTPFLPADQPEIPVAEGVFGQYAQAQFTVGEKSNVNPMCHALHPQHDGLTADYGKDAPSGDDLNNYIGLIKPETFSISNRVSFVWDASGAQPWNPAETLTGTLTWKFDGLRHEGTVRAKGRFAMKRLSPVAVKMK